MSADKISRTQVILVGHDVARIFWCNVKAVCFLLFAQSFAISNTMNLEEEVFKIGKQLEKIVGQEGAVSETFALLVALPACLPGRLSKLAYCKH